MDKTLGIRLPDWMLEAIDAEARRDMASRSAVVRRALLGHFEGVGRPVDRSPRKARNGSGSGARRNARGRK
jgi:hypothetical protein